MLKFLGTIVGLIVLAVCVNVTPAYAASTNLVLTQIQAGGVGVATQELVAIYNNSPNEIDVTDWCLSNKSNVMFACFVPSDPSDPSELLYLPGYSYATAATSAFGSAVGFSDFSITYTPSNQSSGSIVGSSDTIKILDASGQEIDQHNWTTSLSAGMQFARHLNVIDSYIFIDTDTTADWSIQSPQFIPEDQVEHRLIEVPDIIEDTSTLLITELLPNVAGSDTDHEFIEIYNPNNHDVSLDSYKLWVGPNFDKSYSFPEGSGIAAGSYLAFSNADISFSLLNSSSRVRITTSDGQVVSETPAYESPKDDKSWALVDNQWQYTNVLTPGEANVPSDEVDEPEPTGTDTRKPCASNQFRNPETGRCKLLTTGGSSLKPCNANQYRSQETNRCRNIVAAGTGLTPCKEGQERNPDTNRCRTITKMPDADYSVLGTQTSNTGTWYMWAAIGGILLLAIGYAIWEWHHEIAGLFQRLQKFVRPTK